MVFVTDPLPLHHLFEAALQKRREINVYVIERSRVRRRSPDILNVDVLRTIMNGYLPTATLDGVNQDGVYQPNHDFVFVFHNALFPYRADAFCSGTSVFVSRVY